MITQLTGEGEDYIWAYSSSIYLSDLATRYGRDDPRVLAASRRLDKLIVEFCVERR